MTGTRSHTVCKVKGLHDMKSIYILFEEYLERKKYVVWEFVLIILLNTSLRWSVSNIKLCVWYVQGGLYYVKRAIS